MSEPLLHWIDGESVASVDGTTRTGTDPSDRRTRHPGGGAGGGLPISSSRTPERLAMLDSIDSGKPINEMMFFDIPFTVDVLRYYAIASHGGIAKVTFTGSVATGKSIVRSSADDLKRVSLELGGKSPNIVFDDADLDEVVAGAAAGAFATQGESCIAGSRLYVQRGVFDEVVRRMADYAASINLGRGTDPATQMGPLISAEHRDKVLGYMAIGVAEGAQVVAGGHAVAGEGYFAEPTVLVNAKPDSRIMHEEIFGPVVCAVPFDTENEVLALANNTRFGLGAAVWTRDISRAHRMAAAIESGQVWVNCYQAADSALPFGGTKESGWGRETCRETLEEYLETKTVVVSL
jgi:phenylacetaldehyde dehydrogenase